MTGWQAGTQSFVPKSCDFVVVAKNRLTLPFRSFDDWHESHDCQGTRWKQAATNQGPWPKNEYKCQISTFVFLLEARMYRVESGTLRIGIPKPRALCPWYQTVCHSQQERNIPFSQIRVMCGLFRFRFPKFVSCVGCSDLRVQEFFECTTKTERCVSRKVVIE